MERISFDYFLETRTGEKAIARGWWSNIEDANRTAEGMSAACWSIAGRKAGRIIVRESETGVLAFAKSWNASERAYNTYVPTKRTKR